MKTQTEVHFYADRVPGGVNAVLGPAQCGTDVADIWEPNMLGHPVIVTLEDSDPRLRVLLDVLAKYNQNPTVIREDIYTFDELAAARLILLYSNCSLEIDGDVGWETTFDLTGTCPGCYAASRQTQPYIMTDEADLARIEGKRLVTSYWEHILVDDRLADALIATGATGLSFHPVYARIGKTRQIKMHWKQLATGHVLPRMSAHTTGLHTERPCNVCHRSGFHGVQAEPLRPAYEARDLNGALDVNESWEGFGFATLDNNKRPVKLSVPGFLVTPKVWRVLHDAGVDAVTFLPIRVV